MKNAKNISICYVLNSFPEPSETFIADEAMSVVDVGADLHILHLKDGRRDVVHPTAEVLLARGQIARIAGTTRWRLLLALLRLLVMSTSRTVRTLRIALQSHERWCYFLTLPAAVSCLRHRVDILHAHYVDTSLLFARALSDWTGIPYGVTAHRYDIFDDPLTVQVASDLLHKASVVVTISEFNRRHMVEKYGVSPAMIDVVHCGIDVNRFSYNRHKLFFQNQSMHLLNIGRLVEEKGQDILLRAVRLVRDRGVPCFLEIIGGGPLHEKLAHLSTELGLEDVVKLHGAQPESVVRERLQAADLFVLSSHSEGIPVVCMEAMSIGTPVIATRITGLPELIEHDVNGFLVEPGDSLALADEICRVYSRPQMLDDVRWAARKGVEQGFERKGCTEQLVRRWQAGCVSEAL